MTHGLLLCSCRVGMATQSTERLCMQTTPYLWKQVSCLKLAEVLVSADLQHSCRQQQVEHIRVAIATASTRLHPSITCILTYTARWLRRSAPYSPHALVSCIIDCGYKYTRRWLQPCKTRGRLAVAYYNNLSTLQRHRCSQQAALREEPWRRLAAEQAQRTTLDVPNTMTTRTDCCVQIACGQSADHTQTPVLAAVQPASHICE